jgi:signal transduction histidine kinase/CheY-like chemotaxis protein
VTTLQTLLLVYIISLLLNSVFALQFWLVYKTSTYKKLVILWLLTTANFLLQGLVAESIIGSLLTFPTYIAVAYYSCSLLAETSSIPFHWRPFNMVYLLSLAASAFLYQVSDNFTLVALPVAIGVAAPQIIFALQKLIKYRHTGTQFSNSFAVLLLLNGLHFLDYPFLRPYPQMAIFGFGLVLIFSICFAALLPSILNKYHTDQLTKNLLQQIEKRELVEKDLAIALIKSEHLANVKSIFLANVSHEIRTPLTGIIGLNDLLLTTALNPEQKEYCDDIANASQKLRRIINNVLNLSKLESGTVVVEQEKFTLHSLVNEVSGHYARHNKTDIAITCFIQGDSPKAVVGDKGKLQQIAFNLIDNAIKYSQSHVINLAVSYDFSLGCIHLCVSDDGIGIAPDVIEKLFHPFEQKHAKSEGVGLGLAIVDQLVNLMQGTISVTSELGKGAAFSCQIPAPVADELDTTTAPPASAGPRLTKSPKKTRLLVIDDNLLNLKTVATLLTQEGYQCVLAENGLMAKKIFDDKPVDLILTDIQLPDVHGFELIKHFRKQNPHIPIIAYSAFAFDEDVASALEIGATDYLRKPAIFSEIKTKLQEHLK